VRLPSVTIAICVYTEDRWTLIGESVASAVGQRPPPDEVLVVVDHNPRLLELARQLPVRTVPHRGPRGLSGARNTALAEARGEVVAFLDDDAAAGSGWLAALLDPFDDPRVLATGGSSRPAWSGGRPRWFPPEFDWVVGSTYLGLPEERAVVRNVIGCNMAFRRRPLLEAGGFDPALGRVGRRPIGAEETEACIRLTARHPGSRVVYEPAARVLHHVPPKRTRPGYFLARCWGEGRSKAVLAGMAGTARGLETERSYVTHTLPRGVLRGAGDVLRGDGWGALRAAAIVAGLVTTGVGYLAGRLASLGVQAPAPVTPALGEPQER
jgi:GT2 family glycosyltransferase